MSVSAQQLGAYTKVDVETASQGKLIVMLFNGALKRSEEAKRQLQQGNYQTVHNNLIRAQEIISELRGALNMSAGEVAENLDRIYEYFQHLLIQANVKKSTEPIDECMALMTGLRDTWQELFENLAREQSPVPPKLNQHGNAMINLQG